MIVQRVRDLLAGCGFTDPPDLNAEAPAKLARYLSTRLGKARKGTGSRHESGISAQSAVFYLAAARRFTRWLAKIAPIAPDLFDGLGGYAPHTDRKHARRDVSIEELARLIEATEASTQLHRGLHGPERAALYLTAFATGFRAGELSALAPESFDLEGTPPVAVLAASQTKNRKRARQPLPPGLALRLRPFLAGRAPSKPVWPGPWRRSAAAMLKKDLARAGVPYKLTTMEGDRYADFHALRHSYLSALAAAGVAVKELQDLARHSDPRLTLGIYTHSSPAALGSAVARLQLPGTADENPFARMSRAELEAHAAELKKEVDRLKARLAVSGVERLSLDSPVTSASRPFSLLQNGTRFRRLGFSGLDLEFEEAEFLHTSSESDHSCRMNRESCSGGHRRTAGPTSPSAASLRERSRRTARRDFVLGRSVSSKKICPARGRRSGFVEKR